MLSPTQKRIKKSSKSAHGTSPCQSHFGSCKGDVTRFKRRYAWGDDAKIGMAAQEAAIGSAYIQIAKI